MPAIDLTRVIRHGMPVYPGDPPVRFAEHSSVADGGFRVTRLELGSHTGTHVDAPAHVDPAGRGVDALSLESLAGEATVIDVSHRGPGDPILAEDLAGQVPPRGRALLRTDWDREWSKPTYHDAFPPLSAEAVELLVGARLRLLGLETPSVHPAMELAIHRRLLNSGIIIVEGLVELRRLPPAVWLVVAPLPLAGLDGAPCRVLAFPGVLACNASEGQVGSPPQP